MRFYLLLAKYAVPAAAFAALLGQHKFGTQGFSRGA